MYLFHPNHKVPINCGCSFGLLALRHDVLAALSPAQRSIVAATIGRLAVAENPDVPAASRQIDALLSPQQRQVIPVIVSNAAVRTQTIMEQMLPVLAQRLPMNGAAPGTQPQSSATIQSNGAGLPIPLQATGTIEAVPGGEPQPSDAHQFTPGMGGQVHAQIRDQMLEAMRSQTAGSIVIGVLSAPTLSSFGPFPGTMLIGPK